MSFAEYFYLKSNFLTCKLLARNYISSLFFKKYLILTTSSFGWCREKVMHRTQIFNRLKFSFRYSLCCQCGVAITPNPSNMCVACLRTQVDITADIPKQVVIYFCKFCERWAMLTIFNPGNFLCQIYFDHYIVI